MDTPVTVNIRIAADVYFQTIWWSSSPIVLMTSPGEHTDRFLDIPVRSESM